MQTSLGAHGKMSFIFCLSFSVYAVCPSLFPSFMMPTLHFHNHFPSLHLCLFLFGKEVGKKEQYWRIAWRCTRAKLRHSLYAAVVENKNSFLEDELVQILAELSVPVEHLSDFKLPHTFDLPRHHSAKYYEIKSWLKRETTNTGG